MAYSMRRIPKSLKSVKLENDISFLGFNLHLSNYFEESMMKITKMTRQMKGSLYPHGVLALSQITALLPQPAV